MGSRVTPVLSATAILVGTIVGAGIFALPAASARSGVPLALAWLVFLTFVTMILHLMYGEVVLRTEGRHRLVGYATAYLGRLGARWATVSALVGSIGVLLAYLVLTEAFLSSLLSRTGMFDSLLKEGVLGTMAWAVLAGSVAFGLKTVARLELAMAFLLIFLIVVIAAVSVPRIALPNLLVSGSLRDAFVPYGVFLFALSGAVAVPEMRDLFDRSARGFRRAIVLGTLLPASLYALFIVAVVGAFGAAAQGTVSDVLAPLGSAIAVLLALFGVVAVASSFLVFGAYLVDTLRYDLRLRSPFAVAALVLPLLLFLAGLRDFVVLVAFIGTVLGALDGTLVLLMWRRARSRATLVPAYAVRLPAVVAYAMMALFFIGLVVEVATILT